MATYNGWTNYETWCVHLWLSNDQGLYSMAVEMAKADEWGDTLKEYIKSNNPLEARQADVYTDLLTVAISEVNWHEIAKAFRDE
jgi:hypothetical protein